MSKYFNYFPKTIYQLSGNDIDSVMKITSRFNFEQSFKDNTAVGYEYDIQDGDTPEIIANKLYGSSERHWIVLLFNNIVDPQFDWPLDQRTLIRFIEDKYKANANVGQSGLNWAQSNNHSYYIIEKRTTTNTGDYLETKTETDANTYANATSSITDITLSDGSPIRITMNKESKSYYIYETENNDSKRTIKLLKPEFVPAVEEEFRKVIR